MSCIVSLGHLCSLQGSVALRSVLLGGEKTPRSLGSGPWKSQRNDPLRSRYITHGADRYNPLNQILEAWTQMSLATGEEEPAMQRANRVGDMDGFT